MLWDFSKPWVEQVCFEILDSIEKTGTPGDEHFEACVAPEDWQLSTQYHALGLRATAPKLPPEVIRALLADLRKVPVADGHARMAELRGLRLL